MANAVITDLTNQHLNGTIAVSGQDATAQGLQHILDGDAAALAAAGDGGHLESVLGEETPHGRTHRELGDWPARS